MSVDVLLPRLGESIASVVILRWLKLPGQMVNQGDILAELETDKASLDLESPASGLLSRVNFEAGATVTTGQQLAVILIPGEDPGTLNKVGPVKKAISPDAPVNAQESILNPTEVHTGQRVSPAARKLARELGVEIQKVSPAHPGDRISTEDVRRFAEKRALPEFPESLLPSHRIKMSETRKTIARRMSESAQTIPQFSITLDVEMDAFNHRLQALRSSESIDLRKISFTSLLVYLLGKVLPRHPLLNASCAGEEIVVYDTLNVAVAVSTERGLLTPVIHAIQSLTLSGLIRQFDEAIQKAKTGILKPSDLNSSTFTISNLGMYGVSQFIPLINPPQSAILGVGAIQPSMILTDQGVRPSSKMSLSLSADHRVLDGSQAAHFLADLKKALEQCDLTS